MVIPFQRFIMTPCLSSTCVMMKPDHMDGLWKFKQFSKQTLMLSTCTHRAVSNLHTKAVLAVLHSYVTWATRLYFTDFHVVEKTICFLMERGRRYVLYRGKLWQFATNLPLANCM